MTMQSPRPPEELLAEALKAIIIRCEEGDPRFDWRKTIISIANIALRNAAEGKEATAPGDA